MPRTVKCALIQCSNAASTDLPIEEIKRLNIEKHLHFIEDAAKQGVQISACRRSSRPHIFVLNNRRAGMKRSSAFPMVQPCG